MAGRFLSLEEAAQALGSSADEVHRLVDRKKLFPIRDGSALKFKAEDIEAYSLARQEEAGTGDDLEAQFEAVASTSNAHLEIEAAAEEAAPEPLTLDVEAMIDLEPNSVDDSEPASVVAVEEPLSDMIILADEAGPAGDAASVISGLSSPLINTAAEASGEQVVLADSGRLSLDQDDLELESIIAASAPSLPVNGEPQEGGTLTIDLGEPILGDPVASGSLGSRAGSLAVGSDDELMIGSNPPSGAVGSALSDVLDSGVLIEEKAVELEGIQTWDEVDLGIEEADVPAVGAEGGGDGLGDGFGGDFDNEKFTLGDTDDGGSIDVAVERSEASDLFPSGVSGMDSAGYSGQSFGGSTGFSASIDLSGERVPDARFSTWQTCGLICCSLILLTGGLVAFDLVRTIGSPQDTALANPLLDALAEVFGWR